MMADFAKKWPWWETAARMKVGLLKRPQATVPHLTRPKYTAELDELGAFSLWVQWYEGGRKGARPRFDLPVLPWAWEIQAEYHKAHAKPPVPPPGKEAVSIWKNPPVMGRGAHVAWGFNSSQFTPGQLAEILAQHGFKWSALEDSPANNTAYFKDYRDALHANGLKFLIWARADTQGTPTWDHFRQVISTYEPDGFGADIEVFPIQDPTIPEKCAEEFPSMYRTTIVAGMAAAEFYADWEKHGWDCMTESYAANIGQPPVPGIAGACDVDAYWRGFPRNAVPAPKGWGGNGSGPHTFPILEVNAEGNPGLQVQLPAIAPWGDNYSIWLAEQMQADDWTLLKI